MTYKQKTIKSMAFFLTHRYDAINKLDALKELGKIWTWTSVADRLKAYKLAFEN